MFIHPLVDGPATIKLGVISLPFYGLTYFVAFLFFEYLGTYRCKKYGRFTADEFYELGVYLPIGAALGGRIGDILFYRFHSFSVGPWNFIAEKNMLHSHWVVLLVLGLWCLYVRIFTQDAMPLHWLAFPILTLLTGNSGMSFHGAFIGGLLALLLYSHRTKHSYLAILDFIAPLVIPVIALGRFANFVNGELWGRKTTMPWGVIFPRIDFALRHPSQLYECFLEGIVPFFVLWHFSKRPRLEGTVFGLTITLYATARIFVEFFREPSPGLTFVAWGWLTRGQLLSLPMLITGVGLLYKAYLRKGSMH